MQEFLSYSASDRKLVSELLDATLVRAEGAVPLQLATVGLGDVAREAVERHRPLAGGHEFVIEVPDALRLTSLSQQPRLVGGVDVSYISRTEAVAAFLAGRIGWSTIPDVLNEVLDRHDGGPAHGVDDVIDADRRGRAAARSYIDETADIADERIAR